MANKETEGEDVADYPTDIEAFRIKLKDESFDPPPPSTSRRQSRSILDFFEGGIDTADSGAFNEDPIVVNSSPMVSKKTNIKTGRNFEYSMNHKDRGIFLIFNHWKFRNTELEERSGAHSDRDNLEETARTLGFQVEIFDDMTKAQIKHIIKTYANNDHSNHDCIACAVLTHGEYGNILHAKDSEYHISTLLTPFRECPSLAGKPKLFFIQACRGVEKDRGIKGSLESDSGPIESDYNQTIPIEADFLIGYSTVSGYLAWRNEEKGSWYIQSLCRCLREFSNQLDLLSIMTRVNRMVAYDCVSSNHEKQMPSCVSRLTGDVYFKIEVDCIPDGKSTAKASTILSQQIDSAKMSKMPLARSELRKEVYNIKLVLNDLKRKELDLKSKLRDAKEKLYQQELKSLQE